MTAILNKGSVNGFDGRSFINIVGVKSRPSVDTKGLFNP